MRPKIKKMINLELGILFLVLIIFIVIKTNIVSVIPKCFTYTTFGILCPACKGTRCVMNLINGNFLESFNCHTVFFITILYLIFVNIIYIINSFRKKEVLKFLYPKKTFWITFLVVLIIFTILRNII